MLKDGTSIYNARKGKNSVSNATRMLLEKQHPLSRDLYRFVRARFYAHLRLSRQHVEKRPLQKLIDTRNPETRKGGENNSEAVGKLNKVCELKRYVITGRIEY